MKKIKDMARRALHPGTAVTALLVSFGNDEAFRIMMESVVGAVCMPAVVVIAAIMLRRSRPGGSLASREN